MRLVLLGCSCAPTSALAVDSARALATAAARSDAAQAPVGYGDEQRHKLLTASSCHARRRRRRAARPQGPAAPRRAAHQGRPLPELPARDRERCGRAILPALLLRGGERGKTGSAPSMPVPMQLIASAGRRTSKEAAQAHVRGAQCLWEGLMSSIYRSQWSGAPFSRRFLRWRGIS
jgi:hypothetical protein